MKRSSEQLESHTKKKIKTSDEIAQHIFHEIENILDEKLNSEPSLIGQIDDIANKLQERVFAYPKYICQSGKFAGLNFLALCAFFPQLNFLSKFLIEQGAEINLNCLVSGPYQGTTPLWWAVYGNNTELAKELIKKGANIHVCAKSKLLTNYPIIAVAIHNGSIEMLRILVNMGIDVNLIFRTNDNELLSLLHVASINNRLEAAKFLLETGASIDPVYIPESEDCDDKLSTGFEGRTPLWYAKYDNLDMVKLFLEYGADVNAAQNSNSNGLLGVTPIWIAACNSNLEAANIFIENNADVNVLCAGEEGSLYKGHSPLSLSIEKNKKEFVKALIIAGADVTTAKIDELVKTDTIPSSLGTSFDFLRFIAGHPLNNDAYKSKYTKLLNSLANFIGSQFNPGSTHNSRINQLPREIGYNIFLMFIQEKLIKYNLKSYLWLSKRIADELLKVCVIDKHPIRVMVEYYQRKTEQVQLEDLHNTSRGFVFQNYMYHLRDSANFFNRAILAPPSDTTKNIFEETFLPLYNKYFPNQLTLDRDSRTTIKHKTGELFQENSHRILQEGTRYWFDKYLHTVIASTIPEDSEISLDSEDYDRCTPDH